MKAQCELQMATKQMEQKMLKSRVNNKEACGEEMLSLFYKLQTLVPNMPRHKKVSKLEIIQNVIDYIMDLQLALEAHPSGSRPSNAVLSAISPNRQPLGVLAPAINTCAAQEVTQSEKLPIVDKISANRPVSC